MPTEDIVENPKAITTWSGFIYQGKIALIIALNTILQKYQNDKSDKNIFIHVEEYEDISVTQNGDIQSIHQVKCKAATTLGSYNDAISSLSEKATTLGIQAFLHLSVAIDNDPDEAGVTLYEYDQNKYLNINEVHSFVKNEIIKIRAQENLEILNDLATEILAYSLYQKINEIIESAHYANQSLDMGLEEVPRDILLHDLYQVICSASNDIQEDEEYYISKMKEHLSTEFDLYVTSKQLSEEKKNSITSIASKINNLSKERFYIFLKTINPFWCFNKLASIDSFHDASPKSFIRPFLNFLEITIDMNGNICSLKHRYELEHEKIKYIPLSIDDDPHNLEILAFRLEKALSKNNQFIKLLYEGDNLISREVNRDCILSFINEYTKSTFKYLNTNDFNSPMKVPLISFRDVLQILGVINA